MKIYDLKIENFLAIGEIHCTLADRGLVLVQGENRDDSSQDSNGSGKSSFPDAIMWALYGETARGEKADAVINITEGKNCRVSVSLDDNGSCWRVTRHRKFKGKGNSLMLERFDRASADWVDETQGTDALTQAKVLTVLGCSADVFSAAVYAGQERMPDLPAMTDKQLKALVEEAAGITELERAYDFARLNVNGAQSILSQNQLKLDIATRAVQEAEETIAHNEDLSAKWAADRKQRLVQELAAIKAETARIDALGLEDLAQYQAAVAAQQAALDGFQTEVDEERALQAQVSKAERAVAGCKARTQNAGDNLQRAREALQSVDVLVGTPCGECGKPYISDDLDQAREIAQTKLDEAKRALDTQVSEQSIAERTLSTARDALDLHRAAMTDTTAVNAALSEANAALMRAKLHNQSVSAARTALGERRKRFEADAKAENPHNAVIEHGRQKLASADSECRKLKAAVGCAAEDLKYHEIIAKLYGPAGVRAHILDTVTPFLNQRTAEYLGLLTDGNITAVWSTLSKTAKGEVREKFSIEVASQTGAASFGGLSGGEKRKVRLACAMALQDLVATRASKPIELFIADEIDQALDESGLERLMAILDQKARERGTVLVISHNSLQDWIRSSVTVVKENGKSTMDTRGIL